MVVIEDTNRHVGEKRVHRGKGLGSRNSETEALLYVDLLYTQRLLIYSSKRERAI